MTQVRYQDNRRMFDPVWVWVFYELFCLSFIYWYFFAVFSTLVIALFSGVPAEGSKTFYWGRPWSRMTSTHFYWHETFSSFTSTGLSRTSPFRAKTMTTFTVRSSFGVAQTGHSLVNNSYNLSRHRRHRNSQRQLANTAMFPRCSSRRRQLRVMMMVDPQRAISRSLCGTSRSRRHFRAPTSLGGRR